MYRVTTPTHTFTLPIETSTCKEIQITYQQYEDPVLGIEEVELIKHYQNDVLPSGMTLDGKKVYIRLTQQETKSFAPDNPVATQVRVLTTEDNAYASQMFYVNVNDVLNEEILTDG